MAHLTYFETFEEYNNYRNSEEYVEPNITFCLETDKVYFDDDFTPTVEAVFTAQANETVKIADSITDIIEIRIDDDTVIPATSEYTFETAGEHKVEYMFDTYGVVPSGIFKNLNGLTEIDLSKVTQLGSMNLYQCNNVTTFGTDTFNFSMGGSCFQYGNETQYTKLTINGDVDSGSLWLTSSTCSITDLEINGDVKSGGNFNFATITGITINGDVLGGGNFGSSTSPFKSFIVNGDIVNGGNTIKGDNNLDAVFHVTGDIKSGGNYFYSAGTITVDGSITSGGVGISARRINIGSLTNGASYFTGLTLSQDDKSIVHILGDVTFYNGFYCNEVIVDGNAMGIYGDISGTSTVAGDISNSFYNMPNLTSVTIGGSIGSGCFTGSTTALTEINLTGDCLHIDSLPLAPSEVNVAISTMTPPTLNTELSSIHKIYVLAEALETYKTTGNWATYASQIYAME